MLNPNCSRIPLLRATALLFLLSLIAIVTTSCSRSPEQAGGSLEIVAIMPLTGPVSYLGQQELAGLRVAVDEINASGGINGLSLNLIAEDTQGNPKTAVTIAQKHAAGK